MSILLALSLIWLIYIYLGYPALLFLLRGVEPDPHNESETSELPSVTVLIAAYDEIESIEATVHDKLRLEYPEERLEVIVISDGSTDGTDEAVRAMEKQHPGRVRLIRQAPRQGKTSALNLAVPGATGQILVFSDANSLYEPGSLRRLVGRFQDLRVGYVTGKMIYTNPDGTVVGDGCTAYMRYENVLRSWETRVGSVVGVDGGIDAVRRELYVPMNPDQLPDFVLPLRVVEQGYRVVYEPGAVLRESALGSTAQEYRMRVRVTLRALWALRDLRQLFDPFRYTIFSWQLVSHKLLRYFAFMPQVVALSCNLALLGRGGFYLWLMAAQGLFYGLALIGYLTRDSQRNTFLATAPYYLTLLNLACAHATFRFLKGEKQVMWKPRTG